jgi:hypothetical protein
MVEDDEDSIPFSAKSGNGSPGEAASRSPVEQNEAEQRRQCRPNRQMRTQTRNRHENDAPGSRTIDDQGTGKVIDSS